MAGGIAIQGTLTPNGPFPITDGPIQTPWQGSTFVTIYVRPSGSDTTGDGSSGNPYATVTRAYQDIPSIIYGAKYVIDVTGMLGANAVVLPRDQAMFPARVRLASADQFGENETSPAFATFDTFGDVTILAVPALDATGGTMGVFNTDYIQTHDAPSGLCTIVDVSGTKNWPVNGLVGKLYAGSNFQELGFIVSNTANTVTISADHAPFNSNNPGIYNLTADMHPFDDGDPADIVVSGSASFAMMGIHVVLNADGGGIVGQSLTLQSTLWTQFTGCFIEGLAIAGYNNIDPNFTVNFLGCHVSTVVDWSGPATFVSTFFDTCVFTRFTNYDGSKITLIACWVRGCDPLGSIENVGYVTPEVPFDNSNWRIEGCLVENATSHGFQNLGGESHIGAFHCVSAGGSAVFCSGGGYTAFGQRIRSDAGGVARYGLEVSNGARVVGAQTGDGFVIALGGTLGDIKVGTRAPRSQTDFINNVPQGREFDYNDLSSFSFPTDGTNGAVGPTGQHGTGTIVWTQGAQTFAEILPLIEAVVATFGEALVYLDDGGSGSLFVLDQPANFDHVKLIGTATSTQNVSFASGFVLQGTRLWLENISTTLSVTLWTFDSSAPTKMIDWYLNRVFVEMNGGAAPMAVLGGASNRVTVTNGSVLVPDAVNSGELFALQQGSHLNLLMNNQATFANGFVVGLAVGATAASFAYYQDGTCPPPDLGTYPIAAGITVVANNVGSALAVPYAPAAGNFTNPQPTTVGEALDRIATALSLSIGHTIP